MGIKSIPHFDASHRNHCRSDDFLFWILERKEEEEEELLSDAEPKNTKNSRKMMGVNLNANLSKGHGRANIL
ncbi:unnamed protein product [Caenorhabditis nigoni]